MREATNFPEAARLPQAQANQYAQALERVEIDITRPLQWLFAASHVMMMLAVAGLVLERLWNDWPMLVEISASAYIAALVWAWSSIKSGK